MAVVDDIAFTRQMVVLGLRCDGAGDRAVVLDHGEAVEMAAGLAVHVALGAIDAGEVVDPGDELTRIARAITARAVEMLCEALPRLAAIRRAAEQRETEAARLMSSGLGVHDGGGEVSEARAPALAVVRDE